MKPYTIIVIQSLRQTVIDAVTRLQSEHPELGEPQIVLFTSDPNRYEQYRQDGVIIEQCDFSESQLKQLFMKLPAPPLGVICRGDMYVQYFRKVVPFLPASVLVSSEQSLEIATNKRLMRQAFITQYPEITPAYVRVSDVSLETIALAVQTLQFPVIVKPASLASSLLIQSCTNEQELTVCLESTFAALQTVYLREKRFEKPEVIVEEYLEGDCYSVDCYVQQPGQVSYTPLVSYVPAKQIGINDFFLYKRSCPTSLSDEETLAAQQTAKKAILATGLQYSSVHVELIRTSFGWKIIELGPRIGRFRNMMYKQSYGIDHGYNDLLVHVGLAPELIVREPVRYCVAYSIYPEYEGTLVGIRGIDEINQHLTNAIYIRDYTQAGQTVRYAKNGGHALVEVIFCCETQEQYLHETSWFEQEVKAIVEKH